MKSNPVRPKDARPKGKKDKKKGKKRERKDGKKSEKKGVKELSPEELARDYEFFNKGRDDMIDIDEYDFDDD